LENKMQSREGNSVPPLDAQIRTAMPKETLCRKCVHTLDKCALIEKMKRRNGRNYNVVVWCAGFEELTLNVPSDRLAEDKQEAGK
jgi:hypothetical protein